MTAIATKLLDEFKKLPPAEQLLVRERVISLTAVSQQAALKRLRGASTGKRLLEKLLADRTQERRPWLTRSSSTPPPF